MRGIDISGADIDAPWLMEEGSSLLVNGVDVVRFVEAELDRRFPGRSLRLAADPAALVDAWAAVEVAWAEALGQAAQLPAGSVDVQVDGEWSFAQTLRHLVMATDTWLGGAILRRDRPYHPIGQPNADYAIDGHDIPIFGADSASYDEVLLVRADRVAMVRDFIAGVTAADLAAMRTNPWAPQRSESVLSCLQTILGEEWEHLRYALRDLAVVGARGTSG